MARLLIFALALAAVAGCSGPGRQPVPLAGVDDGAVRGAAAAPLSPAHDCTSQAIDAGDTRLARIGCRQGTGSATVAVSGCAPGPDGPAWLSVETPPGRFGQGNATARVAADGVEIARLRIAAAHDEGKEARIAAHAGYVLTLDIDGWRGEEVTAAVQCAA